MLFNIKFWHMQKYLPTKRYRKLRERYVKNKFDVEIKEVTKEEFPVAFIIHDYKRIYKNAKSYKEFNGDSDFKMFSEEIRTYEGKLFLPVRVTHGSAISLCFETLNYIREYIEDYEPYQKGGKDFTEDSIIKEDNIEECKERILRKSKDCIIYEGKVWKVCTEPMYVINTFGLGHNHGGTDFSITYGYNSNISKNNYFNALEREEAITYGKKVATNRGDTESINRIGKFDNIEVLMPEMVKRNPQKEHGDTFINSLENMINNTDSSVEAGLLAITMCMKN